MEIINVATTLDKSNFNRSIYYLLYMTIPSGGPRIKADFAHDACVIFNQNCDWLAFQNSQRYSEAIDYWFPTVFRNKVSEEA